MRRNWVFFAGYFVAFVVVAASASAAEDSHDKVQLWKGGPYWATTNVGADNPWDFGLYFWWGDTVGYRRDGDAWVASDGSSSNFSFNDVPTRFKVNSELQSEGWITTAGVLAPEHDAAQAHCGGAWRMPTKQELSNLKSKCDWTEARINQGVIGYIVRGRGDFAGASIFLPAAGRDHDDDLWGYYWSSVPTETDSGRAWYLGFYATGNSYWISNYGSRRNGQSVRPVQGVAESVFRFYSKTYKGHFFTISEEEKETIKSTNPNWKYEGTAYQAFNTQEIGTVPLYRFYSKGYRGHFFTIDAEEAETVKLNRNWKYEGIAYYVYPEKVEGTVPVFRFWSKGYRHHFYTTNEAEKEDIRAHNQNWKYEGIAFYALPAVETGTGRSAASGTPRSGAFEDRALPEAEGAATDVGAPGGRAVPLVIRSAGVFPMGVWTIEVREEAPDAEELSACLDERPTPSAFPTLHVALPEGAAAVSLWSASVGTVSETANPGPEAEFFPEAASTWYWLRALDETGEAIVSLWIRLLP